MKKILIALTLLSFNAFAVEALMCDGQVNLLINPKTKMVDLIDHTGNPSPVKITMFQQLRNGPHTYAINGSVKFYGKNMKISVRTKMSSDLAMGTHLADITLGRNRFVSACGAGLLP